MRVIVCVKPVPDPDGYDKIRIDPVTKRITREGVPTVVDPMCKNAVELALELKKAHGASVTVITMAPPSGEAGIRELLAMGADDGILLSDRAFGGADTLSTAYTLSEGIKHDCEARGAFDVILCGSESADGATAQVAAQLGEWLGVPHLWNAVEADISNPAKFVVKTKIEDGVSAWEISTPCLIAVAREINRPRFISAMGIIKAKNKPIVTWGKADLPGIDENLLGSAGSPTKTGEVTPIDLARAGEMIGGTPEEAAARMLGRLRAEGAAV